MDLVVYAVTLVAGLLDYLLGCVVIRSLICFVVACLMFVFDSLFMHVLLIVLCVSDYAWCIVNSSLVVVLCFEYAIRVVGNIIVIMWFV